MKGSEKQIKYAQDILENLRNTTEAELNRYTAKGNEKGMRIFSEMLAAVEKIESIEDAGKIVTIAEHLNIFGSIPKAADLRKALEKRSIEDIINLRY